MVTGAAGQLGSTVVNRFSKTCEVEAFNRARLELADGEAVRQAVAAVRPDFIINCAAYNDVDGAEDAAEVALRGNSLAVRALARAAT
jgi:dTDP-4-dehydrorhamnose reductase